MLSGATNHLYLFNEDYFEEFFEDHGFVVVHSERLKVEEQIAIVNQAKEIVASMGTLTHFALFAKPNTKMTMFTRTDNDTLYPQCLINEAKQVDYQMVDTSINFLPQHRYLEPCLMGETKFWKQYVNQTFNENISSSTWKDKLNDYVSAWCHFHEVNLPYQMVLDLINRTANLYKSKVN